MNKIFICLIFLLAAVLCRAQNNNFTDPAKQYLFENFSKGLVLLKTGAVENGSLNYNTADQSIVFEKDGKVMVLTGLESIDTIYFKNKRFIPGPDGLVYEVIINAPPAVSLYVTYTNKMKPAVAVTDQNGTTHKEASEASNTMSGVYVSRAYSGDYIVEIQKSYWLIKSKQVYKATSLKQFEKVFPHKDAAIESFVKDNEVNFNLEGDLVKLTMFCNGQLQ